MTVRSSGIVVFVFMMWLIPSVWAEEVASADSVETDEEETACADLSEKIDIMLEAYDKVSTQFKTISDRTLCNSMSDQCEYFYASARASQKEYREECDPDYEIVKVEKCDYSENPCVKRLYQRRTGSVAGTGQGVKDNPFGVKILTLFTGEEEE
ncbi:MAG: hypothetical protein HYU99_02305 [Deltaproteobacteria bacterium]|nr:hypothetical protein [Deltaproteobacteria bacterium]